MSAIHDFRYKKPMNTFVFIYIWIILCYARVTKCVNYTNYGKENASESAGINPNVGHEHLRPVEYNLEQWLSSQTTNGKKVQSITIIPILALIVFLWILCFRVCKWMRQDSKYKERGCSYDVTSYVIVREEDKDFDDVDFSSSAFYYDTVTSKFSLQEMLDYKMYDTVTSHASFLKQYSIKHNRRSPTPDKKRQEHQRSAVQKKGRFSVAPVIDNYVRLKNNNNVKRHFSVDMKRSQDMGHELSASLSGNSFRLKRKVPPSRSTSDSRLSEKNSKSAKKSDVGLQVRFKGIKERLSQSASIDHSMSESEYSSLNFLKTESSVRSSGNDVCDNYFKRQNQPIVKIENKLENKLDTTVEIHSEDNAPLTTCSNSEQRNNDSNRDICCNGPGGRTVLEDSKECMSLQKISVADYPPKATSSTHISSATTGVHGNIKCVDATCNNHRKNSISTSTANVRTKCVPYLKGDNNNAPKYGNSELQNSCENNSVCEHIHDVYNDSIPSSERHTFVYGAITNIDNSKSNCCTCLQDSPSNHSPLSATCSPSNNDTCVCIPSEGPPSNRDACVCIPSEGLPSNQDTRACIPSEGLPSNRDACVCIPSEGLPSNHDTCVCIPSEGPPSNRDTCVCIPSEGPHSNRDTCVCIPSEGPPSNHDTCVCIPSEGPP